MNGILPFPSMAMALIACARRFRLAASVCLTQSARVLRHRALSLYRLAKRRVPGVQLSACLAESCRLYAATEKLAPPYTERWVSRWARAVDLGCACNAAESHLSKDAWFRVFKALAEQPNGKAPCAPCCFFYSYS